MKRRNPTMSKLDRTESAYARAGVDIEAKANALASLRSRIRATHGPNVLADIGHFGGVYALPGAGETALVASIDGVGTKLKLAIALGTPEAHAGIGRDIVHHCVNDILCCGARPIFFLDYLAVGASDPATIAAVVGGVADACLAHTMALLGGETAELPGIYAAGDYDLAGCIIGSVSRGAILNGSKVQVGDLLLGLPAAGLHTNGYSLARRAFGLDGPPEEVRERLAATPQGLSTSLGASLLAEHRSYAATLLPAIDAGPIHALAHITGGGLVDNVPRVLPAHLAAHIEPSRWAIPPLFAAIQAGAQVADAEMYRVFNMGIGMVAVISLDHLADVQAMLPDAVVIGKIIPRGDGAPMRITGIV
ncbi:MAG: phosphoribosylformylglycinamidine cyclo-ligase [Chloroflexota bacterium]|nr:phosphoribosylformylglycinamidine cyclo-ligase [Chloroflexota bacterium]